MSWLSKGAKKAEHSVSRVATKLGVGNDLKKAANIFGAAQTGGAVGFATGFLTGGFAGGVYGAATGATVAGYGKYRGDSASKYLSNAAGDAAIVGSVGPMIFKPAGTALITAPGPVSGYGSGNILVKTSSGGLLGSVSSGVGSVFKDSVDYIGKGGFTQLVTNGIKSLFAKKDPATDPNPDYQQGNAVPPGGSFGNWLSNVLPGKAYDPTAPGSNGSAGGGGSNPTTNVEVGGSSLASPDASQQSPLGRVALYAALALGGFLIFKKGGILKHA